MTIFLIILLVLQNNKFIFLNFKTKKINKIRLLTKYLLMLLPIVARNLNNLWLLHNVKLMRLHWAFLLKKYCPSALNRNMFPIDGNAFFCYFYGCCDCCCCYYGVCCYYYYCYCYYCCCCYDFD